MPLAPSTGLTQHFSSKCPSENPTERPVSQVDNTCFRMFTLQSYKSRSTLESYYSVMIVGCYVTDYCVYREQLTSCRLDKVSDKLSLIHHPAFLGFVLKFFKEVRKLSPSI